MKDWQQILSKISVNRIDSIQVHTVLLLLIIAVVIFCFFYLFRRYIVPFLGSRKTVRKANIIQYRLEVVSWSIFALFGVYQLLTDSLYLTLVLLFIVILSGLNFWKDLLTGVAFKIENKFEVNDPVRFDEYIGTLEKIGIRNIQIKTDGEELVLIPFRKLSNSLFIKRQAKGKLYSAKLCFTIEDKKPEDIIVKVQNALYQCPWIVINEKHTVEIISNNEINITVYAIDQLSINKAEIYLQKKINKL